MGGGAEHCLHYLYEVRGEVQAVFRSVYKDNKALQAQVKAGVRCMTTSHRLYLDQLG